MIWLIAMDGIVPILGRRGLNVVTYADELVIFVAGFASIMRVVCKVRAWEKFKQYGIDAIYQQF